MPPRAIAKFSALVLVFVYAMLPPVFADGQPLEAPVTVVVKSGALTLHGLFWHPSGRNRFPAVLFNHGSGPASDLTRPAKFGSVFVRHGYAFLYLFRRGAGLSSDQGTDSEKMLSQAFAEKGQDARNELQLQLLETELGDVSAGLAFLRARPEIDAHRIAVVGHSFGGQLAVLQAERAADIRAAVVFGVAARSWDTSPKLRSRLLASAAHAQAPIFFIHAANDFSTSSGEALSAEMTLLGKQNQLKVYPPVGETSSDGHDFVLLGLSTWEPDVFAFLDKCLQP